MHAEDGEGAGAEGVGGGEVVVVDVLPWFGGLAAVLWRRRRGWGEGRLEGEMNRLCCVLSMGRWGSMSCGRWGRPLCVWQLCLREGNTIELILVSAELAEPSGRLMEICVVCIDTGNHVFSR